MKLKALQKRENNIEMQKYFSKCRKFSKNAEWFLEIRTRFYKNAKKNFKKHRNVSWKHQNVIKNARNFLEIHRNAYKNQKKKSRNTKTFYGKTENFLRKK